MIYIQYSAHSEKNPDHTEQVNYAKEIALQKIFHLHGIFNLLSMVNTQNFDGSSTDLDLTFENIGTLGSAIAGSLCQDIDDLSDKAEGEILSVPKDAIVKR